MGSDAWLIPLGFLLHELFELREVRLELFSGLSSDLEGVHADEKRLALRLDAVSQRPSAS